MRNRNGRADVFSALYLSRWIEKSFKDRIQGIQNEIDECIEGIQRLMNSTCTKILNIGSDEIISINDTAHMVADIAGYKIKLKHISGPTGVRGTAPACDSV